MLLLLLLGLQTPAATAPTAAAAVPRERPVVLRSVTLVDVEAADGAAARRPGTSVVLRGDEIVAVGPDDEVPVPPDARVLDGAGRYLLPGLFDMHVHLAGKGEAVLGMLVAHGVTSARDLGGDMEVLDEELARVERGEIVGPRVARAGLVIEEAGWLERVLAMLRARDPERAAELADTRIGVRTPEEAVDVVARVAASGADLLKVRNTPPREVFRALMEQAREAGLRVAAHEPTTVDLVEAASLGLGSLEHPPIFAVLAGTSEARWAEVLAAFVDQGVSVDPTLVAMRGRRLSADGLAQAVAAARDDPRWSSLPPALAEAWERQAAERRGESGDIDWPDVLDRAEAVVRRMHEAGVPFLAGTDLGVPLVYPGSALIEELALLVERVGLTPLEALRAATVNAAAWLGQERTGAVRVGYRADLVLLEADPLVDVANAARIHTVVCRGVVLGPAERERLLHPPVAHDAR